MHTTLTNEKYVEALKGDAIIHKFLTQAKKIKMVDKALSTIILCLGDKFPREVSSEKIAATIWKKYNHCI